MRKAFNRPGRLKNDEIIQAYNHDRGNLTMGTTNMDGMGGMMLGGGLLGILAIIFLLLAIAALIKYLFFSKHDRD